LTLIAGTDRRASALEGWRHPEDSPLVVEWLERGGPRAPFASVTSNGTAPPTLAPEYAALSAPPRFRPDSAVLMEGGVADGTSAYPGDGPDQAGSRASTLVASN
jgi:hypothetical protein